MPSHSNSGDAKQRLTLPRRSALAHSSAPVVRRPREGSLARWVCWDRGPPRARFWAPSSL
eukprot:6309297-Alexandrium_andersonii.AAC.1